MHTTDCCYVLVETTVGIWIDEALKSKFYTCTILYLLNRDRHSQMNAADH